MAPPGRLKQSACCSLLFLLLLVLAPMVLGDDCSGTLARVPPDCQQELYQAIATGSTVGGFGRYQVSSGCCRLLACVREPSCATTLHNYCSPPEDPCP